jgi:hypothetical protein
MSKALVLMVGYKRARVHWSMQKRCYFNFSCFALESGESLHLRLQFLIDLHFKGKNQN